MKRSARGSAHVGVERLGPERQHPDREAEAPLRQGESHSEPAMIGHDQAGRFATECLRCEPRESVEHDPLGLPREGRGSVQDPLAGAHQLRVGEGPAPEPLVLPVPLEHPQLMHKVRDPEVEAAGIVLIYRLGDSVGRG